MNHRANVRRVCTLLLVGALVLRAGPEGGRSGILEGLADELEAVLVDPGQHDRVVFTMTLRGVWGGEGPASVWGWNRKADGVLVFDDGIAVPEGWAEDVKTIDYLASVRAEYFGPSDENDDVFARMELNANGLVPQHHVANAVWAHALGAPDLAAAALEKARADLRGEETCADDWRQARAWFYYAGMVHAYMQGKDVEAKAYGDILFAHFRESALKRHRQAEQLMEEIERRLGRGPIPDPGDLAALPVETRIDRLIGGLDEICVRQDSQPGGVNLGEDERIQALIAIGDAAVPKLLDALENDTRLTRSVHFWRSHAPSRTVLGVHEAALTAIMSILRTEFFDAASTGDNFTGRGNEGREKVAAQLRAYWERYGAQPFDERMMTILRDGEMSSEARREAGWNLATPRAKQVIGTTVWSGRFEPGAGGNPGVAKFKDPTIAEAMLHSLDNELEAIGREERATPPRPDREGNDDPFSVNYRGGGSRKVDFRRARRGAVEACAGMLATLGDPRAGPILAWRAAETVDLVMRCDFALSADALGNASAVAALDEALGSDALAVPDAGDGGEMFAIFWCLTRAEGPERTAGLAAAAQPGHAWYPAAVELVLSRSDPFGSAVHRVRRHRWCLDVLEAALHDETPTGFRHIIRRNHDDTAWELFEREPNGNGSLRAGAPFLDETKYDREWELRRCDRAAEVLLMLLGDHRQDQFQPLAKDRNRIINEIRAHLTRYRGTFRDLEEWMDGGTGWAVEDGRFVPVLSPLGRPATRDDVAAGKALFALDDPGTPPTCAWPVAAEWLGHERSGILVGGDPDAPESREVVVLQVERDADGTLWFGVADGNGFHVVPSREIGVLFSIPE